MSVYLNQPLSVNGVPTWPGATGIAEEMQLKREKGQPNGYAGLAADGKVPAAQLPAGGLAPHTHPQSEVVNLVIDLAAKAAVSHMHPQSEVTGLVTDLAAKAAVSHAHSAAEITSGQFAMARIASGTPTGTKFVRDDGVLAVPAGGGSGGIQTLRKTADQIVNGTAYRDITGLTFAVAANTDYAFQFYIAFRSAQATTGFRFSVNGPAGAVVDYHIRHQTIANTTTTLAATWLEGHCVAYDTLTALTATIAANVDLCCMITGRIKVGATAGTLAARVASELANNDLVVQKGSWGTWF